MSKARAAAVAAAVGVIDGALYWWRGICGRRRWTKERRLDEKALHLMSPLRTTGCCC